MKLKTLACCVTCGPLALPEVCAMGLQMSPLCWGAVYLDEQHYRTRVGGPKYAPQRPLLPAVPVFLQSISLGNLASGRGMLRLR